MNCLEFNFYSVYTPYDSTGIIGLDKPVISTIEILCQW